MSVYDEIKQEREHQDIKWGTEFDNGHTVNDWAAILMIYLGPALRMSTSKVQQREMMMKVAATAVAACEAYDRNGQFPNRHYDAPVENKDIVWPWPTSQGE